MRADAVLYPGPGRACPQCSVWPLPAFCSGCGSVLASGMGIPLGGRFWAQDFMGRRMEPVPFGQCPHCGSEAHLLLDGRWSHQPGRLRFETTDGATIGDLIRRLRQDFRSRSPEELKGLAERLEALRPDFTPEEVERATEGEPLLQQLFHAALPKEPKDFVIYLFLVIALARGLAGHGMDYVSNVLKAVDNLITAVADPMPAPAPSPPAPTPEPGPPEPRPR